MKIHTNTKGERHWAIMIEKAMCPVCKAGYSHVCKSPQGIPFPSNTVHVERAEGNVR